jgi:hypothetical protein
MAQAKSDDKAPALSVCVIAYNSGPTLRTCLERLGAQGFATSRRSSSTMPRPIPATRLSLPSSRGRA